MIWGWQLLSYTGCSMVTPSLGMLFIYECVFLFEGGYIYNQPFMRFRTDWSFNAIDHLLNTCTFDLSHSSLMPRHTERHIVYWIEMSFAATYRCSIPNQCNWNVQKIHLNSPLSIHFISNFNLPGKPFTGCKRNFNFHFLAKHTIAAQHRHLKQTNIFIPNTCSMYFSGTCLQKGVFSMEETHT